MTYLRTFFMGLIGLAFTAGEAWGGGPPRPEGLAVVVGSEDARMVDRFVPKFRMLHAIYTDPAKVAHVRKAMRANWSYGPISADLFDGEHLPYADDLVNLVVMRERFDLADGEIARVLAPGGVLVVAELPDETPEGFVPTENEGIYRKPIPPEIDDWTHYLHGPDNNAVANDTRIGMPRSLQWVADPRWARSHEQLSSASALVASDGRIFCIEDLAPRVSLRYMPDWKLTCRDAFNGALLWRRAVGQWSDHLRHFRAGPVNLPRRLVAVDGKVYVTLAIDAPVSVLHAATGRTLRTLEGTERTDEIVVADGIAYLVVGTSEKYRVGKGDSFYERGEPRPTDYRYITAIDLEKDTPLWRKDLDGEDYVLPLTLTVRGGSVFCQTIKGVMRLDAKTGEEIWLTPRRTVARRMSFSAPTVVATDEILLVADRDPAPPKPAGGQEGQGAQPKKRQRGSQTSPPATDHVEWGVHGWNIAPFPRKNPCTLVAYAIADGSELWRIPAEEGYNSPVDVFVVNGLVYVSSAWDGYDLRTGEKKVTMNGHTHKVAMAHHRCYRDKASVEYLFSGRSGIELLDLKDGSWLGDNSWVRGTCQYGIMPANGMFYTPPNACACSTQVKLQGFLAVAPKREPADPQPAERLLKGPAYGAGAGAPARKADWPIFRHDGARSGAVPAAVPEEPSRAWGTRVAARAGTLTRSPLTQPIVVGDAVYVAARDEHAIHCLDAADGSPRWQFTTGGRIDSAPTYHEGQIICGAADGYVYCLRASDGALAWRFQAAPRGQLISVRGQLESSWPVHGSVLVHDGDLVFTAGRSTYLDGGLRFYRLDPSTGEVLAERTITHIDPATGAQTGEEIFSEKARGFSIEGVTTEILSSDGEDLYLKYMRLDRDGNELKGLEGKRDHLFSMTSLLAEEWFVRTYWFIGRRFGAGWGGWNWSSRFPSGRIMVFDDTAIYGYGRTVIGGGATGHKADVYHLYRTEREDPARATWSDTASPIVRAFAKAGDRLVLAGPPDLRKRAVGILAYENEDEALASYRGERGVKLRVLDARNGKLLSEADLEAMPAFDGLSAANGAIYVALNSGEVTCWR